MPGYFQVKGERKAQDGSYGTGLEIDQSILEEAGSFQRDFKKMRLTK